MPHADQVIAELEAQADEKTAKNYVRHGVSGPTLGVPYAALNQLAKRYRGQHELALGLWASDIHDARILACRIADPEALTMRQLDGWAHAVTDYLLDDALAQLAARHPKSPLLAARWRASREEWVSAAGWAIAAIHAMDDELDDETALALLDQIARDLHQAKNRTRYTMNNALIAIGGAIPAARPRALEVARAIGQVEVDHGQTGCKTPDAETYIKRMAARPPRSTTAKSTAAKTNAAKTNAAKTNAAKRSSSTAHKIEVENINTPGRVTRVDAAKYQAMKKALLEALPRRAPGLTQAEMVEAVKAHLPEALFPGGEKAGWWSKTVQLDLEAKSVVAREPGRPLRWHRV